MKGLKSYVVLLIFAIIILCFKLSIDFSNLNKGVDLVDEGFLLLTINYASEYQGLFSSFNKMFHQLDWNNLVVLRRLKILVDALGVLILGFSAFFFFKFKWNKKNALKLIILLLIALSSASIFSMERALSYNCINFFLLNVSFSFLFLFLGLDSKTLKNLALFMCTALLGFGFSIKLSSIVLTMIFIGFVILFYNYHYILTFLIGFFSGLFVAIFIQFESISQWFLEIKNGLLSGALEGYGSYLFYQYFIALPVVQLVIYFFLPFLLFFLFIRKGSPSGSRNLKAVHLSVLLLIVEIYLVPNAYSDITLSWVDPFESLLVLVSVHICILLIVILFKSLSKINRLGIVCLLIIPCLAYFGSMASLEGSLAKYVSILLMLATVLVYMTNDRRYLSLFSYSFLTIGGLIYFYNYKYFPRGLSTYSAQNIAIELDGDQIFIDEETASFVLGLEKIVERNNGEEDDVQIKGLFFSNLAFISYYLNIINTSTPQFLSFPYFDKFDRFNVRFAIYKMNEISDREKLEWIFINDDTNEEIFAYLKNNFQLLERYTLIDSISNPLQTRLYEETNHEDVYLKIYKKN